MGKFTYILLMLIIAVLFSVFTFSVGYTMMERPNYQDFCGDAHFRKIFDEDAQCEEPEYNNDEAESCEQAGNRYLPIYEGNCRTGFECSSCEREYEDAQEDFNLLIFLSTSILGVLAIVVGLVSKNKKLVHEWIINGFLLGGLISIFVGTVMYFGDAPRIVRPIIMVVELAIVIIIALKKLDAVGKKKSKKK